MNKPPTHRAGLRWQTSLVVFAVLAGCGRGEQPAPDASPSLTVQASSPVTQALDRAIAVSGSVAAWQEMSLGVELSGIRIAQVLVEVGDTVARGQPLVRLDSRTLEVQARQADAALAQAQANLTLARAESTRGESLRDQRLISASDFDQLKANLLRAEAQLVTAEADRDAVRLNLGFATLVAPEPGVISARAVQPGQVVSAGAELLRLIRDARLEWRAELAEKDLTRVTPGTVVELTGPAGEVVRGRVRAVSPSLDPQTRTGLVYADLPEPGVLRAGMFAQGRIVLGSKDVMVLPREAIVFRDGLPYVFVVKAREGGGDPGLVTVEQRRISVGIQQGDVTEILGGVTATERVAVRGAGFLSDGDTVRVADAAPAGAVAAAPPGAVEERE
ncbi:MAG: efflux RND transporter periplasmic adaptor subunit [Chromatiales bacterium]|jgi:RND family efflux transporter MFP subunit|nr:efflux RND transporter periplasmic adaptor subunit [Chromatiales bacterium]